MNIWQRTAINYGSNQVTSGLVKIIISFALLLLKSDPTFVPHKIWD